MAAADDQKNLFYLVIDMFVIGATTAHKTFHSILVKCHSNQPVRLVFKRVQRSKGSAAIHKAYHRS